MREISPPETPELNGVAERINRTLLQKIRAMLVDCGLLLKFWELALINKQFLCTTCHKKLGFKTPIKLISGEPPKIEYIRRFGCICYRQIPKDQQVKKKIDSEVAIRGDYYIMLYCAENGWEVLNMDNMKVYKSTNVNCVESKTFKDYYKIDHWEGEGRKYPNLSTIINDE